ncbi:hypothetical protein [Lactiplantibacillus pentosus]|uniref:hypothetical protein n=1 Tax=Lactiplantibacillus pentosus TaxID=1589 RepID=UPI001C1F6C55|nr:hypothetical protein [Lactiplantibacillus pentosus]MDY1543517.1 hypothetical protein [Lactiplantibacillus pentosus]
MKNLRRVLGYTPGASILEHTSSIFIVISEKGKVGIVYPLGEVDQLWHSKTKFDFIITYGKFYKSFDENVTVSEEEQSLTRFFKNRQKMVIYDAKISK